MMRDNEVKFIMKFDSIPHEWLIKSVKLAKVPAEIIYALKELIHLQGNEQLIETKLIHYFWGIFLGDSLSVLLFILCVNPLPFLLNKLQGYHIGTIGHQDQNITSLFFVHNLKLYATIMNQMRPLLDQVTQFCRDIGMKFCESNCAYMKPWTLRSAFSKCQPNADIYRAKVITLQT